MVLKIPIYDLLPMVNLVSSHDEVVKSFRKELFSLDTWSIILLAFGKHVYKNIFLIFIIPSKWQYCSRKCQCPVCPQGISILVYWQRSRTFSVKGLAINILGVCRPHGFGQNSSTLLLWIKSSQRQYRTDEQINKQSCVLMKLNLQKGWL